MGFFLSQDQSSHWYVIPEMHREAWAAFTEIPEDDERGWVVPTWALPIGGNPSFVVFPSFTMR